MSNASPSPTGSTSLLDHIPVIWFEPQTHHPTRQLIIYLHPFSGAKELMIPFD